MNARFLAWTTFLSWLSLEAHAQVTYSLGPKVSFNASTVRHPDDSYRGASYSQSTRVAGKIGLEAGLTGNIRYRHLAVQSGVLFSQQGFTTKSEESYLLQTPRVTETYESDLRLNYLTLPLHVALTQKATGQGLQVFAGAYLGFVVGGHDDKAYGASGPIAPTRVTSTRQVIAGERAVSQHYTYSRRQDAGLQAGMGYRYQGVMWQASYSWGLRNLAVDYTPISGYVSRGGSGPPYYHRVLHTSLTYLFDLGGKHPIN